MNDLGRIFIPIFVNRRAYWLRLLVLVPASFILSLIRVEGFYAGADLPGVNILCFAILAAIVATVIGRATEIGANWFSQVAFFLILLSFFGPFLFEKAFHAQPALWMAYGEDRDLTQNLFFLCSAPFNMVVLAAGCLKGDPERWIARLSQKIENAPQIAKLYCQRGEACAVLGRLREAVADYEKAARLKPESRRIAKILSDLKHTGCSVRAIR